MMILAGTGWHMNIALASAGSDQALETREGEDGGSQTSQRQVVPRLENPPAGRHRPRKNSGRISCALHPAPMYPDHGGRHLLRCFHSQAGVGGHALL